MWLIKCSLCFPLNYTPVHIVQKITLTLSFIVNISIHSILKECSPDQHWMLRTNRKMFENLKDVSKETKEKLIKYKLKTRGTSSRTVKNK